MPPGRTGWSAYATTTAKSYIDMTNARDFESRCGRVSIGEVVGQVTYRCEIMARPCKPPMKETATTTK